MNTSNVTTVWIRQHGQLLEAFAGCRFHRGGAVPGVVGKVLCFDEVIIGDRHDPRRGKRLTPADFSGSVTIGIMDADDYLVTRFGLATSEEVRSHPNCKATKYGR